MLWRRNRGACAVVRPNRARRRLRPRLGTADGHCAHTLKSCPRVHEVPLLSSAAHADLGLIGFQTPFARSRNSDKTNGHCA